MKRDEHDQKNFLSGAHFYFSGNQQSSLLYIVESRFTFILQIKYFFVLLIFLHLAFILLVRSRFFCPPGDVGLPTMPLDLGDVFVLHFSDLRLDKVHQKCLVHCQIVEPWVLSTQTQKNIYACIVEDDNHDRLKLVVLQGGEKWLEANKEMSMTFDQCVERFPPGRNFCFRQFCPRSFRRLLQSCQIDFDPGRWWKAISPFPRHLQRRYDVLERALVPYRVSGSSHCECDSKYFLDLHRFPHHPARAVVQDPVRWHPWHPGRGDADDEGYRDRKAHR